MTTTHDAETYSAADCLPVVGWYRRGLEMCGVKGALVTEEECRAAGGKVCRYGMLRSRLPRSARSPLTGPWVTIAGCPLPEDALPPPS